MIDGEAVASVVFEEIIISLGRETVMMRLRVA